MFAISAMECNFEAAHAQLADLEKYVANAARKETSAHDVERNVFRRLLGVGKQLLGSFLKSTGPGDLGPTAVVKDGRIVNRFPEQQSRRLVTVFGEFSITRCVYGTRVGQKIERVPTDERLQLPESDVSYVLQDWDQMLGAENAFGKAAQTLNAIIGLEQPVDTLERGSRQMAEAAPAFRASQPAPDPAAEGSILVASEDNKGVPMVRPVKSEPAGAETEKQEKANKKQMACIGCVYTVNPHVRTSEELIAALFRDPGPRRKDQPHALQKRYWAELTHEAAGKVVRAQEEVFKQLAREVALRRKPGQKL